jgi:hypothetical protein
MAHDDSVEPQVALEVVRGCMFYVELFLSQNFQHDTYAFRPLRLRHFRYVEFTINKRRARVLAWKNHDRARRTIVHIGSSHRVVDDFTQLLGRNSDDSDHRIARRFLGGRIEAFDFTFSWQTSSFSFSSAQPASPRQLLWPGYRACSSKSCGWSRCARP